MLFMSAVARERVAVGVHGGIELLFVCAVHGGMSCCSCAAFVRKSYCSYAREQVVIRAQGKSCCAFDVCEGRTCWLCVLFGENELLLPRTYTSRYRDRDPDRETDIHTLHPDRET